MDAGSPGLIGPEWDRLHHVYCWEMIAAPPRDSNQNGMMVRSFRNLEISVRAILTDATMVPGQDVLAMASSARNPVPHSATGIPPALAMTGRADLLAGAASTIFDHDPASGDILVKQQNGMRNILNARNAAIAASARQALKTCDEGQLPDRSRAFYPIGSAGQISYRGFWKGSYRVIAHASSNLILEKGMQLSKWPKTKCRRVIGQDEDQLDVISDVGDLDEAPLEIAIQPDPVLIDESPVNNQAMASVDEPPDQSDEAYWVDTINQASIPHHVKQTRWTYAFGSLIASSWCVLKSPTIVDLNYVQPCVTADAIPMTRSFIYSTDFEDESADLRKVDLM